MAEVQVNPEDVKTAGYDPRFPNTNQTKHCWANYVFYHRCRKVRGADDPEVCNSKRDITGVVHVK